MNTQGGSIPAEMLLSHQLMREKHQLMREKHQLMEETHQLMEETHQLSRQKHHLQVMLLFHQLMRVSHQLMRQKHPAAADAFIALGRIRCVSHIGLELASKHSNNDLNYSFFDYPWCIS